MPNSNEPTSDLQDAQRWEETGVDSDKLRGVWALTIQHTIALNEQLQSLLMDIPWTWEPSAYAAYAGFLANGLIANLFFSLTRGMQQTDAEQVVNSILGALQKDILLDLAGRRKEEGHE